MRRMLDWVCRKVAAGGVVLIACGVAIRMLGAPKRLTRKPVDRWREAREPRRDWGQS